LASAESSPRRWRRDDWLHLVFFGLVLGSAYVAQTPFYLHGWPASAFAREVVRMVQEWAVFWLLLAIYKASRQQAPSKLRFLRFTSVSIAGALAALFGSGVAGGTPEVAQGSAAGVVLWISFLSERQFFWLVATSIGSIPVMHVLRLLESLGREVALRREAQDVALRAKLAPHFIFNTLNTLKAQIELDPAGAGATADRLAALFRQVLERTDRPTIPLREELAFVESYLGIERARFGDRLRVKIEVAEDLESVGIPPLSLQVLVENGVKHGVAPRVEGGEIRIWARWSKEGPKRLLVGVESPAGDADAERAPGTGTGLAALRGRLAQPEDLSLWRRQDRFFAEFAWQAASP
jgi:hypothetical protein